MGVRNFRRWLLAPVVLAAVFVAAAAAAWAATGAPTVKTLSNAELGTILVNSRGLTLYHLTSEKGGKIKCSGACAKEWPPLLVTGTAKPKAGPGVTASKLGTVRRPDGTQQVTYGGSPLYRYAEDGKPGAAEGEGEGGVWFALSPSGAIVKAAAATGATATSRTATSPSAPTMTTTSGDNGGGGGGYGY